MKAWYCDHFVLPLPAKHRFPMAKYARLRERLALETWMQPENLCVPDAAQDDELLLVHTPQYLDQVIGGRFDAEEQRRMGFPWTPGMVERSRRSVGATIAACRSALEDGVSANLAGGTHHAFEGRGEGFCVFNDSMVALRVLQREGLLQRAFIVDTDVHQGNGTAALAQGDHSIYTLSLHCERNYPFKKEMSDHDIPLPAGTGDASYLEHLKPALDRGLSASNPDLIIFLSGADPFEGDKLGRLALSKGGLRARDEMVLEFARAHSLPVAVTMGGGYAADVEDIVDIHLETLRVAQGHLRLRR